MILAPKADWPQV